MIDLTLLRRETEMIRTTLARRGVTADQVDELLARDIRYRELLAQDRKSTRLNSSHT